MALVDVAYVRSKGNLPSSNVLADDRISSHIPEASLRLKKWVGAAAYADAGAGTPVDPDRAIALKDAEAYLVIATGLPSWNLAITTHGVILEKDLGTQGGSVGLMSPEQICEMASDFLAKAEQTAYDYILTTVLKFDRVEADFENE